MTLVIGYSTAAVFMALALLHFYWAAGGSWGSRVSVPEKDGRPAFTPGSAATIAVGVLLLSASVVILSRLGNDGGRLPRIVPRVGPWVLFAVFLLRAVGDFRLVGFTKRRGTGTAFARWDTLLFSPLSLAIAFGCLGVALRP
jgi:hypothetical protein